MIHCPTSFGHNYFVFLPKKKMEEEKNFEKNLLRVRNDKHPFEACATGNVASYLLKS